MLAVLFAILTAIVFWGVNTDAGRHILEKYFSQDGHIENPTVVSLDIIAAFLFLCFFIQVARKSCPKLTFRDLTGSDQAAIIIIVLLVILHFLRYASFPLSRLYEEDGLFESLTMVCLLVASCLFLASITRKTEGKARALLVCLALFHFFFGMEEISWGQRIFGWDTPGFWAEINGNKETNLHNLFNPVLKFFYIFFNFSIVMLMYHGKKIRTKYADQADRLHCAALLPQREAPFYAIVYSGLILQSFVFGGELTEEIFSVTGLAYAIKQRFVR